MRTKCLLPFLCSMLSFAAYAQRELKNPLIDSKKQLEAGVALHEKKQYKAAIAEYLKIPASDTNYSSALHELYLSSYRDGNYADAEKYVRKAMDMFPEKNNEWLSMLANIYDDTKRIDKAVAVYDSLLAVNKYSYLNYFNRGLAFMRQEKIEAAVADMQKCIMINPYYPSAHYFLGVMALSKGDLVQAMMSFSTSLMIVPANKYKENMITFLKGIAEVNTDVTEALKKYKPGKEDNFESVQELIVNKIALDPKYKLKADLEDRIVRQLQVMMEKLEYDPKDKGFWMQYYVPLFKKIWDTDNFEPMIFNMFSDLDIKPVKDYVRKDKKKIEKLSDVAVAYLNDIRESEVLIASERATAKTRFYIKDYYVYGKGQYTKNEKNENVFDGPWEFYYPAGNLKSAGSFNNDRLTGEWKYYYESGLLKNNVTYRNNKADGKSEAWFDNGVLASSGQYREGKQTGPYTRYYFNGKIRSVVNYREDLQDGPAKFYSVHGNLSSTGNFKDDKYEGEGITYFENGKISTKQNYVANKADGPYVEYFDSGKTKMTGSYSNDEKTGEWKTYFENGQLQSVMNYNKGKLTGEYLSYYENGKPESKINYLKGEIDGKAEEYDEDGILYNATTYEKGRLRDISFFDKKGGLISNNTSRKGDANLVFYLPDGSKSAEGYYTKDGLRDGKHLNYYRNGKTYYEANYKNGILQGNRKFWYANGKLSEEGNYVNDQADGYFINYYNNGIISNEGWYVSGLKQGTHFRYNALGNLTSKLYYLNDQATGVQEHFHPNGRPDYTEYYDNDWLLKKIQYDTLGNILAVSDFKRGEGKMLYLHYSGKPYIETNYRYYVLNGPYKVINPDGKTASLQFYKNGKADSIYRAWFANGQLQTEGAYQNGKKNGTWNYYLRSGKLMATEFYKDDLTDGKDIYYNEDGSVEKEFLYTKGKLNGESRFYAGKELGLVLYYDKDLLLGYSYPDKTGALVPMIKLPGGSGNVTGYFKNGNKSITARYNESLSEGERTIYWPNGKEFYTGKRVNGWDDGVKKVFYPDGKIAKEENFVQGMLHGTSKSYASNGSLISEENYFLGDLHGVSKYYENGKLTETLTYYYGSLEAKK